jgi:hypothetical protein
MPSPSKAAQDRSILEERNQREAAGRINTPLPARPKMAGFEAGAVEQVGGGNFDVKNIL